MLRQFGRITPPPPPREEPKAAPGEPPPTILIPIPGTPDPIPGLHSSRSRSLLYVDELSSDGQRSSVTTLLGRPRSGSIDTLVSKDCWKETRTTWASQRISFPTEEVRKSILGVASGSLSSSGLEEVSIWRARARAIVENRCFQLVIAAIIALNSLYLGVETDYQSDLAAVSRGIENAFVSVFVCEIALRLFAFRRHFFTSSTWKVCWNVFDLVLVCVAIIDQCIISIFFQTTAEDLEGLGVLRMLRVLRVARVFRLLHFFKELWLLVSGVFDAMLSLVWAWLLIFIMLYIFSVLLTGSVGRMQEQCEDEELEKFFGSIFDSMFTLFSVMTINGWGSIARCAMQAQSWTWLIFVLFLLCTSYGMLNVIIAVIVESTLERAMKQQRDLKDKNDLKRREIIVQLFEIFLKADRDGDGHLTREEFLDSLGNWDTMCKLLLIGIDPRKARTLFDILDYDASGTLDMQEFISGVLRVRGEAHSKDILALQCDVARAEQCYREELLRIKERFMERMDRVDAEIDTVHDEVRHLLRALDVRWTTL